MATAMVYEDSKNSLVCSLCLNQFQAPRLLPCYHTFCEKCLSAHITSQTMDSSTFNCPLCNMVTSPTNKTKAVDKWAAGFPLNHFLISVMEIKSIYSTDNNLCDLCPRSDESTESTTATFWCEQCREKLCVKCNKYHSRMKWQPAHNTVPIQNLKEGNDFKMELSEVMCARHAGNELDIYCVYHQELCCNVCVEVNHTKCKDFETVDNIAMKFLQHNTSNKILGDYENMKDQIIQIVEEREKNKSTINEESNNILTDIDNAADKAKQKIDTLRDSLKKSCRINLANQLSALSDSSNSASKFLSNLENCRQLIEVVLRHGSSKHLFVIYDRLCKQLKTHFSQMQSEISDDKAVTLTYKAEDLEGRLKTLGTVGISTSQASVIPEGLSSVSKVMEQMNHKLPQKGQVAQVPMTVDLMTTPVVHVKTVTEVDLGQGKLDLTAGLYVKDGFLLVSDYRNNRLLLLDKDMKFTKEIKLKSQPIDMRRGDKEHEIYVAGQDPSTILCLDIQHNFSVKKTIDIDGEICGIDFYGGNIFAAISDVGIQKMLPDGRVLCTFPGKGSMRYVRVSQKQGRLYHSNGSAVVCRSLDGEELLRYENPSLREPTGICLDTKDNIYICGNKSKNIHQISSDGKKIRVIIDTFQKLKKPWGVVYHPEQKGLLVIANTNKERVCLELYKFVK